MQDSSISRISGTHLNQDEAQRILVEWNRTEQPYDHAQTVSGLIEREALAHPRKIAIIDGDNEIDYARLTARATAICGELAARGVEPGALVGVCMSRTWELVATLLGVLQAGCAYVPLDPEYPLQRVRYMLQHAQAALAIVDSDKAAELCDGAPKLLRLDEVTNPSLPASARPRSRDLAYVIYTSGSTGNPKGVAVEHRSVVAMVHSMRQLLSDEELAGVLAAASVCFDPSVMEILGTLSLGGTVVLAENVLALLDMPSAGRVRTAIMVPSAMQALLGAGWQAPSVRCVVLGGEVLKRSLADRLHAVASRPRVLNVYGPTEHTVFSTAAELGAGGGPVTIGKPVPNARAYILDECMQPVAVGVSGELYLAGDQLARGYLHDPELTRQRFIELDPTGPIPEQRIYRTGDLCRWSAQGEIEFLGRVDQQVKIRGFRIELGEIESVMESMDGVDGAAAALVEAGAGKVMLIGYVVGRDAAVTEEAARAYLAQRLPGYMVPQRVLRLEGLPCLPNGKLDRKRLPQPDLRHHAPAHQAPGELLSIVLGQIALVLGLEDARQVPPYHSFESLGLDSLNTVELSHRLGIVLGRKVPGALFNAHPTAAALTDYLLDGTDPSDTAHAPAAPQAGTDTLARLQAQMQSGHPPFLVAKAPAWSATDKATLVRGFKRLLGRQGCDPYSKFLRTGSAHRGIVADAHSGKERDSIIWTTNLYLGLNRDRHVIEQARSALERFGTGMGTSATASGLTDVHLQFERAFAEVVGKPAACLFPTGYTANLGVIAGILSDKDVVIMDQLCHASIVDGARLCGATIRTFRHNDRSDLESILKVEASPYRTSLVVLEGVYSMGEGTAPVRDIVRTAKQYGALVLVDEAHSFGFYGPRGAGLCADQQVSSEVDFIMTTLSKALGSLGGVIAASEEHIALLKSSSRAYIYQATSTPADIAAALAALYRLSTDDTLRDRLWDTTKYMRQRFTAAGYDLGTGDGPIVTPHFADSDKLYAIARALNVRGIHTAAVTYPIVERARGRLRFICSAAHTRDDVDRTLEALIDAELEVEASRQRLNEQAGGAGEPAAGMPVPAMPCLGHAGLNQVHAGRPGVVQWATGFCAYLEEALSTASGPTPSLAVTFALPDNGKAVTLLIDAGAVTVGLDEAGTRPFCSLLLTDRKAVAALCASDVEGLLECVISGACMLTGQCEAFIWLIARMAEWQQVEQARAG